MTAHLRLDAALLLESTDIIKLPLPLFNRLRDAAIYVA